MAVQGVLGAISTGSFVITLVIAPTTEVQISKEQVLKVKGLEENRYELIIEKPYDNRQYKIIAAK